MKKAEKKPIKARVKVDKAGGKHIVFLLDETGSMMANLLATISGFNEYVQNMLKTEGTVGFTLTKFNSQNIELVYKDEPIKNVKQLTTENYKPNFLTPLYDAIGQTIRATKETTGRVIFVILTDGEENASKEFTRKGVFTLIEEQKGKGWEFVFLGSNQDAWIEGNKIGIGQTMTYDPTNVRSAYLAGMGATHCYFSTGTAGKTWNKPDGSGDKDPNQKPDSTTNKT